MDRASLNVAERTLDDFDVHEYTKRLLGSIPSVTTAAVQICRPQRCGGSQRFGILCLSRRGGGELLYHEITAAQYERTTGIMFF